VTSNQSDILEEVHKEIIAMRPELTRAMEALDLLSLASKMFFQAEKWVFFFLPESSSISSLWRLASLRAC